MLAVQFKMHERSFRDQKRRVELLEQRSEWASQSNLPPPLIRDLFSRLIESIEQNQEVRRKRILTDAE